MYIYFSDHIKKSILIKYQKYILIHREGERDASTNSQTQVHITIIQHKFIMLILKFLFFISLSDKAYQIFFFEKSNLPHLTTTDYIGIYT